MAEKSPQKPSAKKPKRTLKEKRAAKDLKSNPAIKVPGQQGR